MMQRNLVILALGIAVAGCSAKSADQKKDATPPSSAAEKIARGQLVTTVMTSVEDVARKLSLAGEVRPRYDITVSPAMSGVRIARLLVEEGDYVRAGQPLAALDLAVVSAQLKLAQANVDRAKVDADRLADEAKRAESIKDEGALSDEMVKARVAAAGVALASLKAAEASRDETAARLANGAVLAPMSGIVIERRAKAGALTDGAPLFRIVGNNELEIAAEVSERDLLALKKGSKAMFELPNGVLVASNLRLLPSAIDPAKRTATAVFQLANDPQVRTGMYLKGEATLPPEKVITVPVGAVAYDSGKAYVFIVQKDATVKRQVIELGGQVGNQVVVRNGLTTGLKLAAGGVAFLADGDKVREFDPNQIDTTDGLAMGGGH